MFRVQIYNNIFIFARVLGENQSLLACRAVGMFAGRTSFVLLVQVVYILFLDLKAEKAKNVIGVVMIVIVTIVINDFGKLGALVI